MGGGFLFGPTVRLVLFAATVLMLASCFSPHKSSNSLFVELDNVVYFENRIRITERINPYTYRSFYNGAGVGIGDVNNDGLLDLFFSGNQVDCKLLLNRGAFTFEDITAQAGVSCGGAWATGVTFVDINGDGLLDIYVCLSGDPDVPSRNNKLFINNGNLTFTEQSEYYGLDFVGLAVQSAFFDYDKDGDLDCYLLTNSFKPVGNFDFVKDARTVPDSLNGGNKLLRNDNGKFIDVSAQAGIYSSSIGFGLGITLGDFNGDNWTDIYISNDFFERDYLYINDTRGGFSESLPNYFESISMGSMGADFADLDNDGFADLFVTEMLPDSLNRRKSKTVYEPWNKYVIAVNNGYHHQFSRNVLQRQIGPNQYFEVGRFAGVSASEWSWGALLFDIDNDGLKDIFIANGIYKDLLDRDYLTYTASSENIRRLIDEEKQPLVKLLDLMPSSRFINYAFRNEGNFKFTNVSKAWGLNRPMYSSGSAYGDLDNDGDLDLVINNINSPAAIYRNTTETSGNKSVTLKLSSGGRNTFAIGAKVVAYKGTDRYTAENFVTRGFQSSVQPFITLGVGEAVALDSIKIWWPEGGVTVMKHVTLNGNLTINREKSVVENAVVGLERKEKGSLVFERVQQFPFNHNGSGLNDFDRDRLLPHMYSNESGAMSVGDIDGDGQVEIYMAGGKSQESIFLKHTAKQFIPVSSLSISEYAMSEETRSLLVDVDGDQSLDLYMANGGRFFPSASSALTDRLFINNGSGQFVESANPLPFSRFVSTSVVKAVDYDRDGDTDLVIGERFDPFVYGKGGGVYLFANDGSGTFTDQSSSLGDLRSIGMVTDFEIVDVNLDNWPDLVVVGDWMPVLMSLNDHGRFGKPSELILNSKGWWNTIESADFNSDGTPDFVLGNHGLNSFFKRGDRMYVGDFDQNGSVEQIFCTESGGAYYPVADKDELISQLPYLKRSLMYFRDYSNKTIEQIFKQGELATSKVFEVDELASMVVVSEKNTFNAIPLQNELQLSPIYALLIEDLDDDGILDLVAAGNHYQVKPQFGRYDASSGWFLKGMINTAGFSFGQPQTLGIQGQVRDIKHFKIFDEDYIFFSKHNGRLEILQIRRR